jgi:dolichyl-phosphate-mannose--protein O-mannosyl transferase
MRVPSGLLGPALPTDRWRAAATALGVGVLAGVLRFRGLGEPAAVVFDETYYAKDAWALLRTGVERAWSEGANEQILAGDTSGLTDEAAFVSHPPLGKWVIAMGEAVSGLTPLGWRLGVALAGTLAAVVMVYLARRVTRSTLLGGLAGVLVALDGLALTTSRIALLDGTLLLLVVAATALLVKDRDWARARMADALRADPAEDPRPVVPLWRPWRLLMGVALGAACATKWSGVPLLAVFGLLTVVWQAGALADAGARRPSARALLVDAPVAALTVLGAAALTYLVSWSGWLRSDDGYLRGWAASNPPSSSLASLLPDALRSLAHYHAVQYDLVSNLDSDHNWQSHPLGWLVLVRPVLFFRDRPAGGVDGCALDAAEQCVRDVLAVGTPLTWWLGTAAVVLLLWRALARLDWRAWLVVGGVAATWLPWFGYADRALFQFYAVVTLPFLVLAVVVTVALGPDAWARPGPAHGRRPARWWTGLAVGGLLLATVVQAVYFWPIWVADPLPLPEWQLRMWLPRWS